MAWASCELASPKNWKGNGYFPTPMHICLMMTEMQMTDTDKTKTVNVPCMGTGSMLLAASNYSLRLFGQDISLDMVKMATINAYLFMPWMISATPSTFQWESYEISTLKNLQNAEDVLKNIETWENSRSLTQIGYIPRHGNLNDWF